jgi:hypothetical protein
MLYRLLPRLRTDNLADLAADQTRERLRLDSHGFRPQACDDAGGLREQVVTSEDGDLVVPARVGTFAAPAQLRFVHHVVVVERGDVGELDEERSRHDTRRVRISELGGKQDQLGPKALAAGLEDVPGGGVDDRHLTVDRGPQGCLDLAEPQLKALLQRLRSRGELGLGDAHGRIRRGCVNG